MEPELFPALLRYWRTRRGMSQLDLSLQAAVSARHVSYLESARSRPSEEMVLRLFSALEVPLRDQNAALRAAGFSARFPESAKEIFTAEVEIVIAQMMAQHDPHPLAVLAADGTILRASRGAEALFGAFAASPDVPKAGRADLYAWFFDPRLMRPFIVGWERFAQNLVARIAHEQLARGDARLASVLDRILAMPGVPRAWRQPDFSVDLPTTLELELARDYLSARFLVATTCFATPQRVPLDEVRIETCFPLDEPTRELSARLTR